MTKFTQFLLLSLELSIDLTNYVIKIHSWTRLIADLGKPSAAYQMDSEYNAMRSSVFKSISPNSLHDFLRRANINELSTNLQNYLKPLYEGSQSDPHVKKHLNDLINQFAGVMNQQLGSVENAKDRIIDLMDVTDYSPSKINITENDLLASFTNQLAHTNREEAMKNIKWTMSDVSNTRPITKGYVLTSLLNNKSITVDEYNELRDIYFLSIAQNITKYPDLGSLALGDIFLYAQSFPQGRPIATTSHSNLSMSTSNNIIPAPSHNETRGINNMVTGVFNSVFGFKQ